MTKFEWIKQTFGEFQYTESKGGAIIIDKDWVAKNIVRFTFENKFGNIVFWGHNKLLTQYNSIMSSIMMKELELDKPLIDRLDFKQSGGCWVARHMLWKPENKLSTHSWGVAIDSNVKDNPYGQKSKQPPELIKIFEDNEFEDGGKYKIPDGMHMEIRQGTL